MKEDFKGIWIPKEIWLREDLSIQEKVIISVLRDKNIKFKSRKEAAEFFFVSQNRYCEILRNLVDKKLIVNKQFEYKDLKDIVIASKNKGDKTCEWCGCKTTILHAHHYPIPRRLGGTETVNICPNCHYEFHDLENGRYEVIE